MSVNEHQLGLQQVERSLMKKHYLRFSLFCVAVLALCAPAAAGADSLGRVEANEVQIDGALVEGGQILTSPAVVHSAKGPAVVVLDNGQVLHLDAYSTVYLERLDDRRVQVEVRLGRIVVEGVGESGHKAGKNSRFVLAPSLAANLRLAGMSADVDLQSRKRVRSDRSDRQQ